MSGGSGADVNGATGKVSGFQTILVLDSEAAAAGKVLGGPQNLLIQAVSIGQFRHFVTHSGCDAWLCDLSVEGLDYPNDFSRLRTNSPSARVILTGPVSHAQAAAGFIQRGLAAAYVPKPWKAMALLKAFASAEDRHGAAPATQALDHGHAVPRMPRGGPAGAGMHRAVEEPRYRLDERIGEGGMGHVYRAFDLMLEMEVAIKLLRQEFVADQEVLRALKGEARLCMRLTHPHIVRFYDFGRRANLYFLVLEYVQGQTLHQVMENPHSRDNDYVRTVAKAIGSALSYAHAHEVLHNDLTPGNIIIGSAGVLKLIDFGIASAANQHRGKTEYVFGTPAYMSPEQLRCDPELDVRTDIFSLGVLLYQMLTGNLPQRVDASNEELALRPRDPVTGVPPAVARVLDRALAFDPEQRWPSVAALVTAFDFAFE